MVYQWFTKQLGNINEEVVKKCAGSDKDLHRVRERAQESRNEGECDAQQSR
jgi:hypothetical protein